MNYADICNCDTLNGKGFRVTLFVSGCGKTPKCKGCHNSAAWDFNYGNKYTYDTEISILDKCSKPYISGLSLLGGEVFDNLNDSSLINLVKKFKTRYPYKDIWCWTGYTYEELIKKDKNLSFLNYIDILVDGEYIPELKDLSRPYGNSSNQRVIDVKKTLKNKKIIIYNS